MTGLLLSASFIVFAVYVLFFDEHLGLSGAGSPAEILLIVAAFLLVVAGIAGKLA